VMGDVDVPRIGRELAWLQTQLPSPANGEGQALLDSFAAELGPAGQLPSVAAAHTTLSVPRCGAPAAQARVDAATLVFRLVYSHNDLLSGNVLHVHGPDGQPSGNEVQIIDYEYGGYNYCGFDVANHFCEHAGFDFDLDKWYPGPQTQHAWFRAYLARLGVPVPTTATYARPAANAIGVVGVANDTVAAAAGEDDVSAAFLDEMSTRVNQFALASHCWWGLWAIVQAKHSPIDFDFITYCRERFRGYDKHKAAFFPTVPLQA
jgi:thiamine kinase-like enzyme